jgi:hypothetical protein
MSSETPLPMKTSSTSTPATPRAGLAATASRAGTMPFWWQYPSDWREVLGHGVAQRVGHAEAEERGVADVELDDLVALALDLEGAAGEGPRIS